MEVRAPADDQTGFAPTGGTATTRRSRASSTGLRIARAEPPGVRGFRAIPAGRAAEAGDGASTGLQCTRKARRATARLGRGSYRTHPAGYRTAPGELPKSLHASRRRKLDAAFSGIDAVKDAPTIRRRHRVKDWPHYLWSSRQWTSGDATGAGLSVWTSCAPRRTAGPRPPARPHPPGARHSDTLLARRHGDTFRARGTATPSGSRHGDTFRLAARPHAPSARGPGCGLSRS